MLCTCLVIGVLDHCHYSFPTWVQCNRRFVPQFFHFTKHWPACVDRKNDYAANLFWVRLNILTLHTICLCACHGCLKQSAYSALSFNLSRFSILISVSVSLLESWQFVRPLSGVGFLPAYYLPDL